MATTFRALVNIPKAQLKGSANKGLATDKPIASKWAIPPTKPVYESTEAVTTAIAMGTFQGNSLRAYDLAKTWQEYQRYLAWVANGCPKKAVTGKPLDNTLAHNKTFQFPTKHRLSY